jgi:hypothetical protein
LLLVSPGLLATAPVLRLGLVEEWKPCFRQGQRKNWIPAFAGMTSIRRKYWMTSSTVVEREDPQGIFTGVTR